MTLASLLKTTNLDNSLLLGYYGGGNYGDELLLEVLQKLFAARAVRGVRIAYQNPSNFRAMHHDLGYAPLDIRNRRPFLRMTIRSKNIIVGGGGLWGLDMNLNTFLMSMYLFAARFVLRKKVFLVGVGYYNSTTRLGHIGAHFAGKAANEIIVRDGESYTNFKRIQPSTELDRDIAFYAGQLDLSEYHVDVTRLEKLVSIKQQTVFIAVRRFKQKHRNSFNLIVERYIVQHPDKQFILALLELKDVDTESYELLQQWRRRFDNVQVLDEAINPLVLFAYFQKHHDKLMAMAPQFHLILTAHLAGVPFLPVVYDNKVAQLLSSIGITPERQIPIQDLQLEDIESFIDAASEKGG